MPTANEPLPAVDVVSDEVLEQAKLLKEQLAKQAAELAQQSNPPEEPTPEV